MDPKTPIKKPRACIPHARHQRQADGTCWLATIIYLGSSRPNETLKRQGGQLLRNDTKINLWSLHT